MGCMSKMCKCNKILSAKIKNKLAGNMSTGSNKEFLRIFYESIVYIYSCTLPVCCNSQFIERYKIFNFLMESKILDLHCKLLLYLDKRRYLTDMKIECQSYIERELNEKINKFSPLRFLLEVDVMEILDICPDIGELLLKEPLKLQRMCTNILYACLQSTRENQCVKLAQICTIVRVKCLPRLLAPPNTRCYSGLVSFEGVLIAVSKPESYVYHTVWSCPMECEGTEVILHYIPKVPPKCYVCRSVLFENSGLRRCGEQMKATFKLDGSVFTKDFNIVDDLIPRLVYGSKYTIHTAVTKKLTVVLSLEEIVPLAAPKTTPIPKDIAELFQDCNGIPWKFVYCLASTFGISVCPLNCFMHLKISLLVSLTSVKANALTGSNIVHVLAAGYDTRCVGEIMADAAKIADTSITLGPSNITVSTAIIAASGGVCVMPLPLHVYNQKMTSAVLAAIESGEISTDNGQAKLQCAVWAQGMDFKKIIVLNVASVYGAVCRGDLGEYGDDIADFVLQRSIEPVDINDEEKEALKDVKYYIDLVAGIEVTIDDSAETLLQKYFLSARRERPRVVSVSSMNALVATTVTSARLCRRSVANVEDAVLAIWLHVSGSPEPRIAPEEYLQTPSDVKNLNKMMTNFKGWLETFCGTIITY